MKQDDVLRTLNHYMRLVNKIDDYLEYTYQGDSGQQIRDEILGMIDKMTAKLGAENDKG